MPRPGIRSRAGCFTCRRRKKKCNEEKPTCSGCRRNCLECCWPSEEDAARGNIRRAARNPIKDVTTTTTTAEAPPTAERTTVEASSAADAAVALAALRHPQTQDPSDDHHTNATVGAMPSIPPNFNAPPDQTPFVNPMYPPPPRIPSITASSPSSSLDLAPRSTPDADGLNWRHGEPSFGNSLHSTVAAINVAARASTSSASSSARSDASVLPDADAINQQQQHTPAPDFDILGDIHLENDDIIPDDMELVHGHAHTPFGPISPGINDDPAPPLSLSISIPTQLSLFPQHDADASGLLSYYLSRTANSMGNGSTELNPFVCTFVPLAFSNQLVLQLILAQSAVHRQVGHSPLPSDQLAQRYYTDSLRLFRSAVGDYMSGKSSDKLVLTTGSLILSLTEVCPHFAPSPL
jgi:transcription factor-like protein/Zn(2)-Cys(6) binuclear cluster domain-containing protein